MEKETRFWVMENKTKIILTAIGLAAIIVPAVLLIVFSSGRSQNTDNGTPGGNRQINQKAIQNEVTAPAVNQVSATPSPVLTPSSTPLKISPKPTPESTKSSQITK